MFWCAIHFWCDDEGLGHSAAKKKVRFILPLQKYQRYEIIWLHWNWCHSVGDGSQIKNWGCFEISILCSFWWAIHFWCNKDGSGQVTMGQRKRWGSSSHFKNIKDMKSSDLTKIAVILWGMGIKKIGGVSKSPFSTLSDGLLIFGVTMMDWFASWQRKRWAVLFGEGKVGGVLAARSRGRPAPYRQRVSPHFLRTNVMRLESKWWSTSVIGMVAEPLFVSSPSPP